MTRAVEIPPGWVSGSGSRKPLLLVNAYAFSKSSTPPVDQWTHFAKLRPVPWKLVAGFVAIALFCAWGVVATLQQFADELAYAVFFIVAMAVGAVFFGSAAIRSVLAYRKRTGWPHLHGLGIGSSGLSYRLAGGDADVLWEAITSIRAMMTNENDMNRPGVPVLRVEYADSRVDLNTAILDASPTVLYRALLHYWSTPADRHELGTTVAQQRIDGWLASN
jgi:hypothetical protein